MQNHRPPSFFLTNTTTLHHALWLDQTAPDSSISHRWFQTSSTNSGGIYMNHSLKGVSSATFYHVFGRVGAAQFCGVQWKHIVVLGQEPVGGIYQLQRPRIQPHSNPVHWIVFPCLCLTVNLGVWGSWGLSTPSCNWASVGGFVHHECCYCPDHWGFLLEGLWVSHTVSLLPWLPFYFLASALCTCFVWWGLVAKSHLQSIRLVPWCLYVLQCRPFPLSLAPHGRKRPL